MVTAGLIHYVLNLLHITVHIRDVCVFLAPVFSGLTAISTFLLTRELWNQGAGLLAACFIAIVPGYISRSVAGSFDNEGIAIFALQFTYYLWLWPLAGHQAAVGARAPTPDEDGGRWGLGLRRGVGVGVRARVAQVQGPAQVQVLGRSACLHPRREGDHFLGPGAGCPNGLSAPGPGSIEYVWAV
ncbi:hypothetical protein CRENBAI_013241 [Crenichthys baileyi]|uniref:dolichyl-diphosphooligosaccharide--protein glycotransferase n=1 Tax=Crenichthys baileyi TaxID=28760 RepID=A0AAV9QVZ5_9TELE